jgi:drug/metabolite transporter superfamily protein YnfA
MRDRSTLWLWPVLALVRLRTAVCQHWKRIVVGAAIGWVFAVIGGAFALASLEFHGLVSQTTSDELGIVLVLYGVGLGALNAYTFRPTDRRAHISD